MNRNILLATLYGLGWMMGSHPADAEEGWVDPIFNFNAIFNDPLDAQVRTRTEVQGIVTEEVEYTAEVLAGQPVRIIGILAYPQGGQNLPAIFWSQGGMYQASPYWPQVWAAKGYFCLNVTLPHDVYNSFTRFTTERPEDGNLTHLAVVQMRGMTYLTQRPEVDARRLGVGGSSYGGFFSSLIAGADPRVQAGLSFFTTGHHQLGTGYPQFLQLRTTDEVGLWSGTIDPAWRLKRRAVPFLWAVAANDHWHHLPAAIQTYVDSSGDKRLAIAPNWYHALPENIDQMLIDWFDVYRTKTRKPYNQPSPIQVRNVAGKLVANWSWTGENPVQKAELVVAYGRTRPWHDGWLYRYHYVLPASRQGRSASAEVPLPEPDLECLIYGNLTDDRDVVTSTVPITVKPAHLKVTKGTPFPLNTALITDFSPEELVFIQRHGETLPGKADPEQKQTGRQSLRVEPGEGSPPEVTMKLGHIPAHSHRLSLWLKANQVTKIQVSVLGTAPAGWRSRIVDLLRREYPDSPALAATDLQPPVYRTEVAVDTAWKRVELDCPDTGTPIEGYRLSLVQAEGGQATYWIDTIRFEPQWETP